MQGRNQPKALHINIASGKASKQAKTHREDVCNLAARPSNSTAPCPGRGRRACLVFEDLLNYTIGDCDGANKLPLEVYKSLMVAG